MAVVVQRMIDGDSSGVLFIANPNNGRCEEALLSATLGIGEGLVSGRCNADEFLWLPASGERKARVADKDIRVARGTNDTPTIEVEVPADQRRNRCLTPAQVDRICREGFRIASAIGKPQDIEWTLAGGELPVALLDVAIVPDDSFSTGPTIRSASSSQKAISSRVKGLPTRPSLITPTTRPRTTRGTITSASAATLRISARCSSSCATRWRTAS
jgi:pyruvate,water dikinase